MCAAFGPLGFSRNAALNAATRSVASSTPSLRLFQPLSAPASALGAAAAFSVASGASATAAVSARKSKDTMVSQRAQLPRAVQRCALLLRQNQAQHTVTVFALG